MGTAAETRLWSYLVDVYFPQSALASPESRLDYEVQVGQFCQWWLESQRPYRPPTIGDLTRARILECRGWKAADSAIATANHLKRVLTALANHAAEAGLIPFPGRIRNLKEPQREPRAWGLADFAKLIAASQELPGEHGGVPMGDLMPAFYRFGYDTGARISTLLATCWDWLSLGDYECTIPAAHTKDKQELIVELSRSTVDALVQLQVYGLKSRSNLVFGSWVESTFRRIHKRVVYAALINPRCDLADLRGKARVAAERAVGRLDCFHKIRRTTATEIAAVAGEAVASKALGHSSLSVTRRYLDRRRLKLTVQAAQRPEIPNLSLRVVKAE